MQDREMTTDLLHTQKQAASDYNMYATESSHMEVKEAFLDLLYSEQQISHDLFCQMQSRGWYASESAPDDKRQDLKAQFSGCATSCGAGGCPCN